MCGRFSITGDLDFYAEYFAVDEVVTEALEKSWNVAPTDPVYVVAEREGKRVLASMSWGLVPHWAKDGKSIHINSRAETVATNNTFRESFHRRRCLIPADGFYEWGPQEQGRHPHWVYRADGHPMVFAGLWATRHDPDLDDWVRTCTIITTEAEGPIAPIHDRMPLGLARQTWDRWLDRELTEPDSVLSLLDGHDPAELMEHHVSREVNSVRNNGPHLRHRVALDTLF
ncbi:MAG: SOS response-associated peptidase [Actinobacteria bacterium]|nr:SOS response-associated peptidase [Actinomycetota bacterium]